MYVCSRRTPVAILLLAYLRISGKSKLIYVHVYVHILFFSVERNDVHSAIQHENLRKDCLLSAFSVACDERCLLLDEICTELKKCMEAPQ